MRSQVIPVDVEESINTLMILLRLKPSDSNGFIKINKSYNKSHSNVVTEDSESGNHSHSSSQKKGRPEGRPCVTASVFPCRDASQFR